MSVLASDVIGSARDLLLDNGTSYYTWSDAMLERWLDDVLAESANIKRDIYPQVIPIPLVAGSVQQVPAGVLQLMEPYHNVASGNSVTKGNQELISRRFPSWRSMTPTVDASDVTVDARDPVNFHVYPPNNGTGEIMALCAMIPVLTAIGCLPLSQAVIPIPDNYRNALVAGIVSKALGANTLRQDVQKQQFWWGIFVNGIKTGQQAQLETSPEPAEGENKDV